MRIGSIILYLIAWTGNLSAGSYPEMEFSVGKNIVDTTGKVGKNLIKVDSIENTNDELIFSKDLLKHIREERKTTRFLLGKSKQEKEIEAWFFPGTSDKNALVIGGVHGTELSSTEVAKKLIDDLQKQERPYYNVIIVPCLFPDNAAMARNNSTEIGSTANIGRYSFVSSADPNRQMPTPGRPYDETIGTDHMGRQIEKENRLLLQLIMMFKPERIANIHAIRDALHAGIYADPRTDSKSYALGFESDSSLAVEMALMAGNSGGCVPGNALNKKPTALYYKDPLAATKGRYQRRNFSGSSLPENRGSGISLGTWASTAISSASDPILNRDAIRILTIEFPGYKRPIDYTTPQQQSYFTQQVELYASSIAKIFLQEYFVEN